MTLYSSATFDLPDLRMNQESEGTTIAWVIAWIVASLAHGPGGRIRVYLEQTQALNPMEAFGQWVRMTGAL